MDAKVFYKALGKRISELRKAQQLPQKELAERIGLRQQAIFCLQIADRRVPTNVLPALARALDVSVQCLLGSAPAPRISPAQAHHVEQLSKLGKDDRFAVMRITQALSRLGH